MSRSDKKLKATGFSEAWTAMIKANLAAKNQMRVKIQSRPKLKKKGRRR